MEDIKLHTVEDELPFEELVVLGHDYMPLNPVMVRVASIVGGGGCNSQEKRTRVVAAIRNPNRENVLESQEEWLSMLWIRIGADSFFQKLEPVDKEKIKSYVENVIDEAQTKFEEVDPANLPFGLNAQSEFAKKFNHVVRQSILDNVVLFGDQLGIIDNPNDVYIHDICGQDGLSSAIIACLRRSKTQALTSAICCDADRMEGCNFLFVKKLFSADLSRFLLVDAAQAKFKNHPERDTYWIVKEPGAAINSLLQQIEAADDGDLPSGIGLSTCYCHCFNEEDYPFGGMQTSVLSQEEWIQLTDIIVAANFDPNPFSRILAKKAMRLIDCARAKVLNEMNKALKISVPEMPGQWTSGILIRKKAIR